MFAVVLWNAKTRPVIEDHVAGRTERGRTL
jgi:hypothetical protein